MTAIDIGTLYVNNPNLKNSTIEEIKAFLTQALENEFVSNISLKKKSKWALVAEKMSGTLTPEDAEYLQQCSNEVREGFELRDVEISK